ncbi:MAG: Mrp/NBP35 family ATP-binding protein [Clostridia bacterium]|nr:Mrp/NBP35 family ATP-binding protein [Clostridia bacterium]
MSECTHDCSTCSSNCKDRQPQSMIKRPGSLSKVKKVIAIVSGKGGVGKSFVTATLAAATAKKGLQTAVIDADITGPSIPKMFGITEKATGNEYGIVPARSKGGVEIVSANMFLENESQPVVWRGPVIAGMVTQFWTDVIWNEVDYMYVDMPPGTGDVPLTVFQSLPVDGIIIVTSPQELVSMIVSKAVNMARMMNIPVLGIVENMSYVECPTCKDKIYLYGKSDAEKTAQEFGLKLLAQLPIRPENAKLIDKGMVEDIDSSMVEDLFDVVFAAPTKKHIYEDGKE